eukprot:6214218-Pleurochrysis_carterae.AAC.5
MGMAYGYWYASVFGKNCSLTTVSQRVRATRRHYQYDTFLEHIAVVIVAGPVTVQISSQDKTNQQSNKLERIELSKDRFHPSVKQPAEIEEEGAPLLL